MSWVGVISWVPSRRVSSIVHKNHSMTVSKHEMINELGLVTLI